MFIFSFFLYCRTALVDLGLNDVDPGLAPEGARCDEDSLCVNRKCMPVASLTIGPASCKNNCNGHGMCNSKGHCHCDIGYAPPYCDVTGAGGSLDSGPASDVESSSSKWYFFFHENKMSLHNFTNFCFFLFQVHITIYCAATSANHGSYIPTYSEIPKGRMETFGRKGQT